MKIKRSLQYTRHRGFVWSSIIFLIVIISCFIYLLFLYLDLKDSKTEGFAETKKQILQATSIEKIDEIRKFNGEEAYHVIFGTTDNNKQQIIFYPLQKKKKELTTIDQSDIITEGAIKEEWRQQCSSCEFIKITPALVNDKPLWELTYRDESNRYVLDYLSIYDGSRYEQYRFKQMFK
ncbi:DUF5590 domain-containing protein [Virgibacillus halodenitrificans]|uniref:cell wall elongation regulator TseB-like domain-containing protein n=1 Tax=Virgibacillus halodenitrificans TaxID=1482 RepID=UPI000EF50B4F|nr:DUF5590 domain-containing protein [Virgibacillus halodenitrificans]WHX27329.1 DUF5590 domain-containing protein [Virgibacillus halodenitrificans]